MSTLDHPLVQDYLGRLHDETVRLRVDEGRELEAQIREHLTEALGDEPTEARVREVLDRLGEPATLVDEAGGGATPGPGPVPGAAHVPPHGRPADTAGPWREVGALVGLVGSALLFWFFPVNVLLWLGGMVLLVLARRWSVAEKLWGALVLGLSWLLPLLAGSMNFAVTTQVCVTDAAGNQTCEGAGDPGLSTLNIVAIVLTVLWLGLYLWTLVRLARSAARAEVVDYSERDRAHAARG